MILRPAVFHMFFALFFIPPGWLSMDALMRKHLLADGSKVSSGYSKEKAKRQTRTHARTHTQKHGQPLQMRKF